MYTCTLSSHSIWTFSLQVSRRLLPSPLRDYATWAPKLTIGLQKVPKINSCVSIYSLAHIANMYRSRVIFTHITTQPEEKYERAREMCVGEAETFSIWILSFPSTHTSLALLSPRPRWESSLREKKKEEENSFSSNNNNLLLVFTRRCVKLHVRFLLRGE